MDSEHKDKTEALSKQDAVLYIVRKTERIVSVTQILCDLITNNKDISEILRKKTFPVLEAALALRSSRTSGIEDTVVKIKDDLMVLEVYLSTATLSHCVSSMNARLVREEVFDLIDYIEEVTPLLLGERSAGVHISRGMFAVEEFTPARPVGGYGARGVDLHAQQDPLVAQRYQGEQHSAQFPVKDMDKANVRNDRYNDFYHMQPASRDEADFKKTPDTKKRSESPHDRSAVKQKSRRLDILSILQKKDAITIKDVAEVITDCSEKTLQRELLAMVESGVLKKEGERRWSTYSLA